MHIALCHDALIPPPKYGGTERVIYWLAKALNELGHRVTLIAREGSAAPGARFIPYAKGAELDALVPADTDLAHLWGTPARPPRKPCLVTIQGNGQPGEVFHPNTVFISRKHAENHGATHFVYNGIDPSEYACAAERQDYAVFLAKAAWKVKNLEGAIAVARAAGIKLEVLGSRDWPLGLHRVLPRIRGVRYHGMVGDAEKRRILSQARALLFPVRWHEPFGIAVTEALASGCPVLGTPYGSLPEIVTPEVGVLSARGRELAEALADRGRFSSECCRDRARRLFGHLDMARAYLRHYERILGTGALSPVTVAGPTPPPRTAAVFHAETLLPWTEP